MKCRRCGYKQADDFLFCTNCGLRIKALPAKVQPADDSPAKIIEKQLQKSEKPAKSKKGLQEILAILIICGIVVVVIAMVLFKSEPPKQCVASWQCSDWSACTADSQTRLCADQNNCGNESSKPELSRDCTLSQDNPPIVANPPLNDTPTTPLVVDSNCVIPGKSCTQNGDCCSAKCVHNTCRNASTFCGDSYCDTGEDCCNCEYDCGTCPGATDLEQNVFTEPLNYLEEQDFKNGGYTLIRYFKSDTCSFCVYPTDIDSQLRTLAMTMKDLIVVVILDTDDYPAEASKYAKMAGNIYVPFIRVEGYKNEQHGYDSLYGNKLGAMLNDGDITSDIAPLICEHSDYCEYSGGMIVKSFEGASVCPSESDVT